MSAQTSDYLALTAERLREVAAEYSELLKKRSIVAGEIALVRERGDLLAKLLRLEGRSCDLPWEVS